MSVSLFKVSKETSDQMVLEMDNSILKMIIPVMKFAAILLLFLGFLYAATEAIAFKMGQTQISWFMLAADAAMAATFYLIYRLLLKADSKVVIILDKPTNKFKKVRTQSKREVIEEYGLSDIKQIKMVIRVSQGSRLMFHGHNYFILKDQTKIGFWDAANSSNRRDVSQFSEFDLGRRVANFLKVPFTYPEKIPAVTGIGFPTEIE